METDELTLYFPETNFEDATLEIFNTVGQVVQTEVLTSNQSNIQVRELPKGMYWFSLHLDGQRMVEKVMIP